MDLGETQSGRSSQSSFYTPPKPVGTRYSIIPLLAEDQERDNLRTDQSPDNPFEPTQPPSSFSNGHKRRFSLKKQLIRLSYVGAIRYFSTLALIGGMIGTIYYFNAMAIMNESDKIRFNFFTTALSMLLGISLASGLKQIAVNLRWYVLSRRKRPLTEVDAILDADSLTKLYCFGLSSLFKRKYRITTVTMSWIILNIAGQAGVAMLALTYSLSPVIVTSPPALGSVMVSNLSSFVFDFVQESDPKSLSFRQANQLAAHMYGEMSFTYGQLYTNNTDPSANPIEPNSLHNDTFLYYWVGPDDHFFQYVFQQWSYDSDSPLGQFYSNRSIAVSSSCAQFEVKEGANGSTNDIQYNNGTGELTTTSFKLIQPNSTTYYTNADAIDCGPRCANVCAFENNGVAGFYYECQVSFGNVTNVYNPVHVISDSTARIAAGSIALQGYQSDEQSAQFQRYPQQFSYGAWLGGDNATMAYRMSQFAIGAIAGADQNNPATNDTLTSSVPRQGVKLNFEKPRNFYAILGSIAGVQLVLFIGGTLVANKVVVFDSYIAISNLFKPLLKDLDDGSLLDGETICSMLGEEKKVVYGSAPRVSEKGPTGYLGAGSDGIEREFSPGFYT